MRDIFPILVMRGDDIVSRGTAFGCGDYFVTAFHVVGSTETGQWHHDLCCDVAYHLGGKAPQALEPVLKDSVADVALLRLKSPPTAPSARSVETCNLLTELQQFDKWSTIGFPRKGFPLKTQDDGVTLHGEISSDGSTWAADRIQVQATQGTDVDWGGISGAPIIVNNRIAGVITDVQSRTGIIWACTAVALRRLLETAEAGLLPRVPREIALLQASLDRWWRFEASTLGDVVTTAVTLEDLLVEPPAKEDPGISLKFSPSGDLAVTLVGRNAQLWEFNPITGRSSRWLRFEIPKEAENKPQLLAVREKNDDDAWVAIESGGQLFLATGFRENRSVSTLLVPCGTRRPVRAGFSRTSLIFLTDGEGRRLLHELILGETEPRDWTSVGESTVYDMDVAQVADSTIIALLVKREKTELIIEVEGKRLSTLALEGTPNLLGVVRAPAQPLSSLCVLVSNRADIEIHHPLKDRATTT